MTTAATPAFNPFAGMREAQTNSNGSYLTPGRFKLRIGKVIWKKLFKGGEALIVETTVLESSDPVIPVGSARTWLQKSNESFKASAKLFCYAACGYDVKNEKHEAVIKASIEPHCETIMLKALNEGFLIGREVFVDVTSKEKKQTEGTFNLHTFSPAQPTKEGLPPVA